MRRYLPAALLALAGMACAPVLGRLRDILLDAFPRGFLALLAACLGGAFLALLGYGALGLVAALVAVQTFVVNRGIPTVDVVEKVHFVQFGLVAFLLYRAQRREGDLSLVLVPFLGAILAGTLEEGVQWWSQVRVGDVKDVALNAYAGLCGLFVSLALLPPEGVSVAMSRRRWRRMGALAALVVAVVGAFYHAAHLGNRVVDPQIGSFRSWSTAEGLLEASADRARRWARKRPNFKSVFGAEDRYATEAGWHVSHRNVSRDRGWVVAAWRENQILEKYFSPFLDVPSPGAPKGHRLSPAELKMVEDALPRPLPAGYESPVLGRIDTELSPARLWTLTVLAMALSLVLAEAAARRWAR
jgi:hypothetical protein